MKHLSRNQAHAERLRQVRQARKISQGRIARAIGVSVGTIQNYESGRCAITTGRLVQLARALQCEPADLLRPASLPPPRYRRLRESKTMSKLMGAVRELVDAVIILMCIPDEGDEAVLNEQRMLHAAMEVLREILASPELASLHEWAQKRLDAHGGDGEPPDETWWFEWREWVNRNLKK